MSVARGSTALVCTLEFDDADADPEGLTGATVAGALAAATVGVIDGEGRDDVAEGEGEALAEPLLAGVLPDADCGLPHKTFP